MNKADKAVSPIFGKTLMQSHPDGTFTTVGGTGMTLLEHYAGMAMQALISHTARDETRGEHGVPMLAKYSVEYARALIAELEKP